MKLFIITIISAILSSISYGLVIPIMWAWFIIPVFHLPALTFWYAIGIYLTISILRPVFPAITQEYLENEKIREKISVCYYGTDIVFPWIVLLTGCIVKCFIPA